MLAICFLLNQEKEPKRPLSLKSSNLDSIKMLLAASINIIFFNSW